VLRLILQENSFQFCGKNYLQTHETAMGNKMAVAFANQIFYMGKVETEILSQSAFKPLVWKRHIDDIFSLWDTNREDLTQFIDQANNDHPTTKLAAKISDTETIFLDTSVYKGQRFIYESVLDKRTTTSPLKNVSTHISPRVTHQCLVAQSRVKLTQD